MMDIIFVDKSVPEYRALLDELSENYLVHILDNNQNALGQIANIIGNDSNLGSLHIVSHGEPGVLKFSSGSITTDNAKNFSKDLITIGNALGKGGDVHLYGCDIGGGGKGEELLQLLSRISGADFAASDDISGSPAFGGDWDLETTVGSIESASLNPSSIKGTLGTPSITNLTDLSYNEQAALSVIDSDISITGGATGGDNYAGGFLEFSLSSADSHDFLRFSNDGAASTTNGQVSIIGSVVYVGNGTGAAILGNVDSTKNGLNGNPLRVNISNSFQNGNFESNDGTSTFGNWQIQSGPIYFGVTQIGGLNTPTDTTPPAIGRAISDQNIPTTVGTYSAAVNNDGGGENSVRLTSTGIIAKSGYDIVRGPALYSDNTVFLRANDKVSFDWKAVGGSDAYDVFGYIVNTDDNSFVEILNETGSSGGATTSWATETVTVTNPGSYRFVFVSGTFDFSGGKWAGAQLYVDNVSVTESIPAPATITDGMVQAIARKLKYESTSDNPPASKTLTVKGTSINGISGAEQSGTGTLDINFTSINDAPNITSGSVVNADENQNPSIVIYDAEATDLDTADTLTFSISGTDSSQFTIDTDDGEVRLKASADYENKSSYSFNVIVTDNGVGGNLSDTQAISLTINNLNDPPVISSGSNGSIAENASTGTIAYDASASDPDSGQSLVFSVSGTDSSLVTIDSDDGEIRLNNSANFEVKNSYSLNIIATDNGGTPSSISKAITINISDQNDSPEVTDDLGITTINTALNSIVVLNDDTDEDGDGLTIQSISYGGSGTVSHNGTTINYTPPSGAANISETINYTVSDGNGGSDTGILTVNVRTPLITGPSNSAGSDTSAITKQENQTAVTTFSANVGVTWVINSGLDGSKFSIDGSGNLTFNSAPNFEVPLDSDGNNTYQVEVKATTTDGLGFFSTQVLTVTVNNVNESSPTIDTTNLTGSIQENANTNTVIYDVSASDADITDILTYSVSGTDASLVTIDTDDGEVRLKSSANFETKNSYSFNVIATDPDGSSDTEAVTVSVNNVNEIPSITSSATVTAAENQANSSVLYTATATDVDSGDNLTFSISGADSSYFTIDADDGEVRLKVSADYETKSSYDFTVIATDDGLGALSGSKAVVLNILNVNDNPVLKKTIPILQVKENNLENLALNQFFTDPDDDNITFSVSLPGGAGLPSWCNFNGSSTILTVNPSRTEFGLNTFEITVNDGNGGQITQQFFVNVSARNNPATGDIAINGGVGIGDTLLANPNIIDADGYTWLDYQWFRDNEAILGATERDYVIEKEDLGTNLTVKASFIDGYGFNEEVISSSAVNIPLPQVILPLNIRNVFKDAFSNIVIKGGQYDDLIVAAGKNSGAEGGSGADILIGGTGDNPLSGNSENDYIIGDLLFSDYFYGNDTLEGGAGDDLLEGGNGSDVFIFSPLDGNDIIAKFNLNLNNTVLFEPVGGDFEIEKDKIDLRSFNFNGFEEVLTKVETTPDGHTQFSDRECTVLIYDIRVEEFTSDNFILI
ncbi:MAG: cadherin domain-containing protein [Paracoccaceae bacterium]